MRGVRLILIIILLVAMGVILAWHWSTNWNTRPIHSVVWYPYLLQNGSIEVNFTFGKSGTPKIVLAEIPATHQPWEPNSYVDDTSYKLSVNGDQLQVGNYAYRIRKEIILPKDPPWWRDFVSKQDLRISDFPQGGPRAYFAWNQFSASGGGGISEVEIDETLRKIAASGHLVAAAVDPDGTVTRVTSFKQLERNGY